MFPGLIRTFLKPWTTRRAPSLVVPGVVRPCCSARMAVFCLMCLACLNSGLVQAQNTTPAQPPAETADEPGIIKLGESEIEEPEFEDLPIYDDKPLPSYEDLLKGPAIDWLIFVREQRVIETEPVSPRPDTLTKIEDRVRESLRLPKGDEAEMARRKELQYLPLTLIYKGKNVGDYKVQGRFIKFIVYYEDLVLRRVDLLLADENTEAAFELLRVVQERNADWPGQAARRERLQFVEARVCLKKEQPESAFNYLEQLYEKNPGFEGLDKIMGEAADQLMTAAMADQDLRRLRHFLARLQVCFRNHPVAQKWLTLLEARAREEVVAAVEAEQQQQWSQAIDRLESASRLWPACVPLVDAFKRIGPRYQRLHVGVLDLAGQPGSSPQATQRERPLLVTPLFEPATLERSGIRYNSEFITDWEPTDLGRSITFRLRPRKGKELLTAVPVAEEISARLQPGHRQYDERFVGYVSGVEVQGPFQFRVDFHRAPLKPEAVFRFPLNIAHATAEENTAPTEESYFRPRFARKLTEPDRNVYLRKIEQPTTDWGVSEIVEHRYASVSLLMQGWQRGEVSFIPQIPVWEVPAVARLPESQLLEYALPVTHLIQFHPRHKALRLSSLRKALFYSLDRQELLDRVVLRGPAASRGRLVSAPFATNLPAYNPLIRLPEHDSRLAWALLLATKKELNEEIPPLRLGVSAEPLERAIGQELVKQWKQLGLDVTLVEVGLQLPFNVDADPAPWDLLLRSHRMVEPLTELWPFLTLDTQARIERLAFLPEWLRFRLIALDQVGDGPAAEVLLRHLHQDLAAEVFVLPLWEVSEFMLMRQNIRGIPNRPLAPYQSVDSWQVQPWYAREAVE